MQSKYTQVRGFNIIQKGKGPQSGRFHPRVVFHQPGSPNLTENLHVVENLSEIKNIYWYLGSKGIKVFDG